MLGFYELVLLSYSTRFKMLPNSSAMCARSSMRRPGDGQWLFTGSQEAIDLERFVADLTHELLRAG
jgi:hypothetical protein